MGKRTFTREFKLEAIRMVNERGLGKSRVARAEGHT
jgi:transposase-like protein